MELSSDTSYSIICRAIDGVRLFPMTRMILGWKEEAAALAAAFRQGAAFALAAAALFFARASDYVAAAPGGGLSAFEAYPELCLRARHTVVLPWLQMKVQMVMIWKLNLGLSKYESPKMNCAVALASKEEEEEEEEEEEGVEYGL